MIRALSDDEIKDRAHQHAQRVAELPDAARDAISTLSQWIDRSDTWDVAVERRECIELCISKGVDWNKPHDPARMEKFLADQRRKLSITAEHYGWPSDWMEMTAEARRKWMEEVR